MHLIVKRPFFLFIYFLQVSKGGVSLEGEVPDKAGVRVIRRGRAAVRSRHYILTVVATVHFSICLHVVAVEHVWICRKGTGDQ